MAGLLASCGITTEDTIRCWSHPHILATSPPEGRYIEVSIGVHHACALRTDGAVVCWALESGEEIPGANSSLFCLTDGHGSVICPGEPEYEMTAMAQSGRVITKGFYSHEEINYTCGYRLDDSLVCWNADRSVFLDPTPTSVKSFAATDEDTACWLLPDDTVACWVRIGIWWGERMGAPEGAFRSISINETVYSAFGCGIRTDGSLSCWGDDDPEWGHLEPPAGEFKAVSTGYGHGCAIGMDDTVVCWGNHNIGTPLEGPFRSINGDGLLHCGVRPDHSVQCWGSDSGPALEGSYRSVEVGNLSLVYLCGVRLDATCTAREITKPE